MFIQNILQITIESGTSSLRFLAETNHWYILRDIYHEIYVDPQTNSISLEMAMRIRQLCKLSSFYLLPTLKTEILSDSLSLAPILAPYLAPILTPYLAPIKVSLGTPEIFNIDSYNWIRHDLAFVRRINLRGPFLTTWTLPNGEFVDLRLEYLRKNILLDNIRWEGKVNQVINSVCFANAYIIEQSLNTYFNGVVDFVDFIKKHGEISEALLQNKIDSLIPLRTILIAEIDNNIDFYTVKSSNGYRELLLDTSDYFSYRKVRPPIFSNQNQFNCALVDVSIHTLDNVSASAICNYYPKK